MLSGKPPKLKTNLVLDRYSRRKMHTPTGARAILHCTVYQHDAMPNSVATLNRTKVIQSPIPQAASWHSSVKMPDTAGTISERPMELSRPPALSVKPIAPPMTSRQAALHFTDYSERCGAVGFAGRIFAYLHG